MKRNLVFIAHCTSGIRLSHECLMLCQTVLTPKLVRSKHHVNYNIMMLNDYNQLIDKLIIVISIVMIIACHS